MTYFKDVILKSVRLPEKPSYNLSESAQILDCHRTTVSRIANRSGVTITRHNRIYRAEFEQFFQSSTETERT